MQTVVITDAITKYKINIGKALFKLKPSALPLSFAHFAAKQMEARAAKTGNPAVLTEFAVYNLERNNHFDCTKAKNELGFAPRPYKETLHDLAVWLKQEGKIA